MPVDHIVGTDWGTFMVPEGDIIGETLKAGTLWDGPGFLQPLYREYCRYGEWGTTILDIGAHFGTHAVYHARKGAWRVIAVEPVEATYKYLMANLDLNKPTCAESVIPLCLAAYDGPARFTAPPIDHGNWGATTLTPDDAGAIKGYALDTHQYLFGQRVSFIKIDAQGCDGAAIAGLRQTIERDRPVIVFEWEESFAPAHRWTLGETIDILVQLGYTVRPWPTHSWNFLALPETTRPC